MATRKPPLVKTRTTGPRVGFRTGPTRRCSRPEFARSDDDRSSDSLGLLLLFKAKVLVGPQTVDRDVDNFSRAGPELSVFDNNRNKEAHRATCSLLDAPKRTSVISYGENHMWAECG